MWDSIRFPTQHICYYKMMYIFSMKQGCSLVKSCTKLHVLFANLKAA